MILIVSVENRFACGADLKYLVTGGAGFIGSKIVSELLKNGHDVVVIDNESSKCHDQFYWSSDAENHKLDICDFDQIKNLFDGVDTVFHCAAEARIQPSFQNPLLTVKTNTLGTCSVLQSAREAGVRRVIYSSTSSAYGNNDIPFDENLSNDCLTPYSVAKVSGESLCKLYYDRFGLETITLRYFNVYGDRQPLRGSYAPVIGLFLRQYKENKPLTIVGDGNQTRDFTHIDDVVSANILAITAKLKNYGQVINIGTGKGISINDIAKLISEKTVTLPARLGEARHTKAVINKAKTCLGWSPKVNLEKWIMENLK